MDFTGERYVPNLLDYPEVSYEHWHRYLYATQFIEGKVVLDIASGEGYGSDLLANTARKVIGVDISEEAVSHAKKNYKKDNLEFLIGSVANIPVDGKGVFDVIVSFETIEHVGEDEQKKFLQEVKRLLKPDGIFISSTPDKTSDFHNDKNEFHIKEFYEKEYLEFLESYFKNVEILRQRVYPTSEIWPIDENASGFLEYNIEHDGKVFKPSWKEKKWLYLVVVSSDIHVSDLKWSCMNDFSSWLTVSRDQQIFSLNGIVAEKEKSIEELSRVVAEKEKSIEELSRVVSEKEKSIEELSRVVSEKEKSIEELSRVVSEKEKSIEELNRVIGERDKSVEELNRVVSERDKSIEELNKIINKKEDELSEKNSLLEGQFKENSELTNLIDIKSGELEMKLNEIEQLNLTLNDKKLLVFDLENTIVSVRKSLSYKVGRFFTFPLRVVYDLFNKKSKKNPSDREARIKVNSKVSVIIPCFNHAHFLPEALDSILNQTYVNWECIIVNDGSTDNTEEVAKEYTLKDSRFRYFSQENKGAPAARNRGLLEHNGDYIQFLDSDDYIAPEKFENQLKVFADNPIADAVYGEYLCFDDVNRSKKWTYSRVLLQEDPLYDFAANWEKGLSIPIHCFLYRKSCFDRVGLFDESFINGHEDFDFYLRLAAVGAKYMFVSGVMAFGRYTPCSMTRNEKKLRIGKKQLFRKNIFNRNIPIKIRFVLVKRYWEMISPIRKVYNGLLVTGSFVKLLFYCVSHPVKFVKKISKFRLKHFIRAMKTESKLTVCKNAFNFIKNSNFVPTKSEGSIVKDFSYERNGKLNFKKEKNPLVTIVIPVYNQWKYTYGCLASIMENTKDVQYEIIIVDDVSSDETKSSHKYVKNIKIIRNEINLGFLKNCNKAAKCARGKYILFLNNDTQVQKEWLKSLVDLIERDEKIGMVGSRFIYSDGRLQEAGAIVWKDSSACNFGRTDDPKKPDYNYVKEVDYISGASIMIRKNLWEQIGGFDERYVPAYCEDCDLAFEVRKHGYKVLYQPKSEVIHFEGISNGTDLSVGVKKYQVRNQKIFYKKWRKVLEKDHFKNGENVFLARDRSRYKKTILVVDCGVPCFDRDAGSKTVFQYVNLFVEMGYNVKFIGDDFQCKQPYTDILNQNGIEVLCGAGYVEGWQKWINDNAKYIDFVFLSRPDISIKYIDFIKTHTKAKIVYYGHDLHYLRFIREYDLHKDEKHLQLSNSFKRMESDIFKKVDVVLTFSVLEKDIMKNEFGAKNIEVAPIFFYDKFNEKTENFSGRKDIMFVGGFGHAPNADAALWFVNEVFPMIKKNIPKLKLYLVGSNPPEKIMNMKSSDIEVTGYVSEERLNDLYQNVKLVVVPLRYGAGVKGKLIEAMHHAMPVVSTGIGIEGLTKIDKIIIPKDTAYEFSKEVINLYKDSAKLKEASERNLNYVKERFSKDKALRLMEKIFS